MNLEIYSTAGNTKEIEQLRKKIKLGLEQKKNKILIYLLQPGLMYEVNGFYKTVVDFVNEWQGYPVEFYSNLVPLIPTTNKIHYTNDMFFAGYKIYQKNKLCQSLLKKLLHYSNKTTNLHWDLLLGDTRENRDILFTMIKKHPVISKVFLTYYGKDTNKGYWGKDVIKPKEHSAETLGGPKNRYNTQIRCSDLIDPEIYNQTYYTAMIETVIHRDFAMFSEKEAKPIVAGRPFIIFGSPGHLQAFRSLGFRSFSPVIDESYDFEHNIEKRFSMCLDAMQSLSKKNPHEVYKALSDVLLHNQKHFQDTEWLRCVSWDKDL